MLGLSMALVVITQVFCRYVLNYSLFWSEELARYQLVWLTFFGATVAYYRNIHPGVDVLYRRLPDRVKPISKLVVHSLSLALFLVMIIFGTQFAYFVRGQTTAALLLPKWTIFSIIPLSGLILLVHAVAHIWNEILALRSRS